MSLNPLNDEMPQPSSVPLSDRVIISVARLVDDAQTETRAPSHSDLEYQINRAGLRGGDPNQNGQVVGKSKRVRAVLSWALEQDSVSGERFVAALIAHLQGCGGFRSSSPNYCGDEAISNAQVTFKSEGFTLASDGDLRPSVLDNLTGTDLTDALKAYVARAKRGSDDAALLTGTGKDLLEATAAHVIQEIYGSYPQTANFPTLLGQAFAALGFATTHDKEQSGEPPQKRVERALFALGCAINSLRNKQGTGHGRPWLSSVTPVEARAAIESMGIIAERMLAALRP